MGEITTVDVVINGRTFPLRLKPKDFSTGSKGFYAWGKAQTSDGTRFQVGMNLVEIGSKNRGRG